jgi:hypothetical protein
MVGLSKIIIGFVFTASLAFAFNNVSAQNMRASRNSYFYAGLDLNVVTLFSNTSIKSTLGLKIGYNKLVADHIFVGPQVKMLLINNPAKKGVRPSLFAGASSEFEITKYISNEYLIKDVNQFSSRLSWIFPINSASSEYIYKDCISLSASYKSDKFNYYRSSVDLNLDFQGYDIGFYNGLNRMVNLSAGSISAFK